MSARQKYRPIENRDLDEAAIHGSHHRSTGPKPKRLHQPGSTETHRMRSNVQYKRG